MEREAKHEAGSRAGGRARTVLRAEAVLQKVVLARALLVAGCTHEDRRRMHGGAAGVLAAAPATAAAASAAAHEHGGVVTASSVAAEFFRSTKDGADAAAGSTSTKVQKPVFTTGRHGMLTT